MDEYGIAHELHLGAKHNAPFDSTFDLSTWSEESIRHMCILAGCDYLDSLPGIGLKTAYKLLKKARDVPGVITQCRAFVHSQSLN